MEVIKYLKEFGLDKLEDEVGIKVKRYDDRVVLNYNQIESPKTHPIVMECRGLILDYDWKVISRSFDRFFNIGEALELTEEFRVDDAVCYEKLDGSLIKLYFHNGSWNLSTRGTAFAEAENYTGETFLSMIAASGFTWSDNLPRNNTYIFEFTSPDNCIVTKYKRPLMYFIGVRSNMESYNYRMKKPKNFECMFENIGIPREYRFDSEEELRQVTNELDGLKEGFVCYDPISGVRVKIKSPLYVAVHKIRGESIPTPKRLLDLVVTNEYDEYLTYFPEERERLQPYITAMEFLLESMDRVFDSFGVIEDQKEFALGVKDFNYSWVLFLARQGKGTTSHIFHNAKTPLKIKTLDRFMRMSKM